MALLFEQLVIKNIKIINKIDLKSKKDFLFDLKIKQPEFYKKLKTKKTFFISAKKQQGVSPIYKFLTEALKTGEGAVFLPRHFHALSKALSHIEEAYMLLKKGDSSLELAAFELKEALKNVQNVLGIRMDVDVLDKIFEQFCIGK